MIPPLFKTQQFRPFINFVELTIINLFLFFFQPSTFTQNSKGHHLEHRTLPCHALPRRAPPTSCTATSTTPETTNLHTQPKQAPLCHHQPPRITLSPNAPARATTNLYKPDPHPPPRSENESGSSNEGQRNPDDEGRQWRRSPDLCCGDSLIFC